MSKKKLFSLAVVVIMVAILSFSTLAWFSAEESIKNDFMIAGSDDDTKEEIFSVDVWENTPEGEEDQDGHVYEDVLPGDVLKKEVTVENTGYYDQYVRVTVTVSDASAWMAVLNTTKVPDLGAIVEGYDRNANVWVDVTSRIDTDKDELIYTLHYNGILQGEIENLYDNSQKSAVTVFTAVKIPASMTVEQAAAFEQNFQITVKAEAVQTENLGLDRSKGDGAEEAFAVVEGTK